MFYIDATMYNEVLTATTKTEALELANKLSKTYGSTLVYTEDGETIAIL